MTGRQIIVGACLLAALSGIALAIAGSLEPRARFVFGAMFGSMAFPLYALTIAHMNEFVAQDEFVEASSVMLLLYANGAALGAVPASMLMGKLGPQGLFVFTASVHVGLAMFAVLWMVRRAPVPDEDKAPFVGVPRTSPTLYALDPRSEGNHTGDELPNPDDQADTR